MTVLTTCWEIGSAQTLSATHPGTRIASSATQEQQSKQSLTGQSTPTDGFVQPNGVRLHYVEWPNSGRKSILLIPGIGGGGGSAWQWAAFGSDIQPWYRVLALETRGSGKSEWTHDYSWQAVVRDIDSFIDRFALTPVILVGHSFGVRLAALYAATHPEKISSLVLVDADALTMDPQAPGAMTRTFSSPDEAFEFAKTRWGTAPSVDSVVRKWMEQALKFDQNGRWIWRLDPRLREGIYRSLPNEDQLRQLFQNVNAPTLVIRGSKSTFTQERSEFVAAAFPTARVVAVPEAGHVVHLANPSGFLKAMLEFLAESGMR